MKNLRARINSSLLNRSHDQGRMKQVLSLHNTTGSSSLISTMKMELSNIRQDVEKLMNDDVEPENQPSYQREVNQELRK